MGYGIVLVATSSRENAQKLASLLLDHRLAGCVQILPIESWYIWQGKREVAMEMLLLIKTHRRHYRTLETLIRTAHPYEVPEIVFLPIRGMFSRYREWLDDILKGGKR